MTKSHLEVGTGANTAIRGAPRCFTVCRLGQMHCLRLAIERKTTRCCLANRLSARQYAREINGAAVLRGRSRQFHERDGMPGGSVQVAISVHDDVRGK